MQQIFVIKIYLFWRKLFANAQFLSKSCQLNLGLKLQQQKGLSSTTLRRIIKLSLSAGEKIKEKLLARIKVNFSRRKRLITENYVI